MKRILVIHFSRMGDMIQSIPLMASLKQAHKESLVYLLSYEKFSSIIKDSPYIDHFLNINNEHHLKLLESNTTNINVLKTIIEETDNLPTKFDISINLTHNTSSSIIANIIKANIKIGAVIENQRLNLSSDSLKYFFSIPANRKENILNLVNIYQSFSNCFSLPRQILFYSEITLNKGINLLNSLKILPNNFENKVIIIQPGANLESKRWPIENFLELIKKTNQAFKSIFILLGAENEVPLGNYLKENISFPIYNLIGKTKIEELPGIIKSADLLISNDSGLSHIAASVQTKSISITFGSVYFAETSPYQKGISIITPSISCYPCNKLCADIKCKYHIDPDSILEAIKYFWKKNHIISNNNKNHIFTTKIDKSSILRYLPITNTIPDYYLTGIIHSYLWQAVLNIKDNMIYDNFLHKQLKELKPSKHQIIADYLNYYKILQENYNKIIIDIKELSRSKQGVKLKQRINDFEKELAKSKNSILKSFHIFEMNNLNFDLEQQIIFVQIVNKYKKIKNIIDNFIKIMENKFDI